MNSRQPSQILPQRPFQLQPQQPQPQYQQQEFYFQPQQNNFQQQHNFASQQPFQFLPVQQSPRLIPVPPPPPGVYPVQPLPPNFIPYQQQQQQPEYIQHQVQPLTLPPNQYQQQQFVRLPQQQIKPQYQPIDPQQQQQQQQNPNMYSLSSYTDPLLNYGTSYPLSTNYFSSDYLSQPYREPANQYLSDIYQDPLTGPNHYNNLIQSQQLHQPIPLPRKTQNLQSQQSNRSFDSSVKQINSPVSFDGGDGDDDRRGVLTQDEMKRQQVWDKLQKTNKDIKSKNNNNNNNVLSKKPPLNKTPRNAPVKQNHTDYIDSNISAIRNKENIGHRYPPKSYENLQNKKKELQQNMQATQFRSRSDTIKKPPGHLDPMHSESESKMINLNINSTGNNKSQSADAGSQALKTISIPINSNVWKDNDRINLDINLRLVDFLNQQEAENNGTQNPYLVNRSLDNFGNDSYNNYNQADPLDQHIRRFENKISRSLPGSTGTLSKFKPLPPLSNINNAKFESNRFDNGKFGKLQYEHEIETQENGKKKKRLFLLLLIKIFFT